MTGRADGQREYRNGRQVVLLLRAHVALVPTYRRGAISDRVRELLIDTRA